MLSLQNVSRSFGALKVADNVSFDVPQGQALGIIGPNGAGKSTLFNLIAGNLPVDAGTIRFNARDVTRMSPVQRCRSGIGRSFQIPHPFDNLTVFENLLVAATHGQGRTQSAVERECVQILHQTGMERCANELAGTLGLLQRKRLELARAMATRPTLLLLDEIAGGLTDAECAALIATIADLHDHGTTIVWIEHVLHALTAIVEKLLVLDFGKVIALGETDDVMNARRVREIYLGIDI